MFYTPRTIVLKVGRSIFLENVVVLAMKNMFSGVKKPLWSVGRNKIAYRTKE